MNNQSHTTDERGERGRPAAVEDDGPCSTWRRRANDGGTRERLPVDVAAAEVLLFVGKKDLKVNKIP